MLLHPGTKAAPPTPAAAAAAAAAGREDLLAAARFPSDRRAIQEHNTNLALAALRQAGLPLEVGAPQLPAQTCWRAPTPTAQPHSAHPRPAPGPPPPALTLLLPLPRPPPQSLPTSRGKAPLRAEDLVEGDREKTLALLWHVAVHLQLPQLVRAQALKSEVLRILARNRLRAQARDQHAAPLHVYLNDETINLLMEWVQAVCGGYGVRVHNFTSSFADGRALCLLVGGPARWAAGCCAWGCGWAGASCLVWLPGQSCCQIASWLPARPSSHRHGSPAAADARRCTPLRPCPPAPPPDLPLPAGVPERGAGVRAQPGQQGGRGGAGRGGGVRRGAAAHQGWAALGGLMVGQRLVWGWAIAGMGLGLRARSSAAATWRLSLLALLLPPPPPAGWCAVYEAGGCIVDGAAEAHKKGAPPARARAALLCCSVAAPPPPPCQHPGPLVLQPTSPGAALTPWRRRAFQLRRGARRCSRAGRRAGDAVGQRL
jgi:hypothetical protein